MTPITAAVPSSIAVALAFAACSRLGAARRDSAGVPRRGRTRFAWSEIRIEGSTVFTPQELAALTAPYANRVVSLEELHELRHTLSRAYVDRGYVSSGVVIPDQRVADGAVTLRAVEGTLADIEIEGNRRWRDRAIARRVERYVATPVDIADLEIGLQALREEPLVERVNAQLLPGAELGESHLRLAITERPAFELEVSAANDRSPTVGRGSGHVRLHLSRPGRQRRHVEWPVRRHRGCGRQRAVVSCAVERGRNDARRFARRPASGHHRRAVRRHRYRE